MCRVFAKFCRNNLQVDDALEFMKDEYNTRMESCDQREVGTVPPDVLLVLFYRLSVRF